MLDLTFSPEQEMLRELVRGVCSQYSSFEIVRGLEDDETGFPAELWKQLGALDLLGLLLPEEHGGSGMSMLEGIVLYEELGRALAPTPHFASCVLSAGTIVAAGSTAQQQEWLPAIANGDAILSPAWLEPEGGFGPRGVQLRAAAGDGGWRLSGTKHHVPFAKVATRLVVLARTGDAPTDIDLFLVDPSASGITITQQHTVGGDAQFRVDFDGVTVTDADRIGPAVSGWATWEKVALDGMILLAAQAVGGAAFAQEITVQYSKDREQFDKPIGAFQAIAHYLAECQTALDGARTLVHEAAWARANDHSVARLAPMAKLFASKMYRDVTATAQQIFGGVGFTVDYDIQLFFRRAKQLQVGWWNDRHLEELIASDVLDGA